MFEGFAKQRLHEKLQWTREALVWKVDGLLEYDIRRPMTATGTNLLGLVKHVATWEARCLRKVLGRPFPNRSPLGKSQAAAICGSQKGRAASPEQAAPAS